MQINSAEAFYNNVQLEVELVTVDGNDYHVREMTGTESTELTKWIVNGQLQPQFWPELCKRGMVNDAGDQMFTDEDNEQLARAPAKVLMELGGHIMRLSGMDAEADAAKN